MTVSLVLKLCVGAQSPAKASRALMEALTEVEVLRVDEPFCGFQLSFASDYAAAGEDHPLLADGDLDPFNRVIISVLVDDVTKVLMDGYITNREVVVDPGSRSSKVFVKGMDAGIKMYLTEISQGYEEKDDVTIVKEVLGRYQALGVTADAKTPEVQDTPSRNVPQQVTNDLSFLLYLAERNDHCFYIKPGPDEKKSTAYWGPRELTLTEQEPPLTAPGAPLANVDKLTPSEDALAIAGHYGQRLGTGSDAGTTISTFSAVTYGATTRLAKDQPPMSGLAGIPGDPASFSQSIQTLKARSRLIDRPFSSPEQAGLAARARSDGAVVGSVRLTGELDTLRYEAVLDAPGVVLVRGTGKKFDGLYYVKQVAHKISLGEGVSSHRQSFTLTREALGTTRE